MTAADELLALAANDPTLTDGAFVVLAEALRATGAPKPAKPAPVTPIVVDCPAITWEEYGDLNLGEFGDLYADELHEAARELVRPALIVAWRKRGYRVRLVERAAFYALPTDEEIADETYWQVRQEAADSIDLDAVLAATDLTTEYTAHYQD